MCHGNLWAVAMIIIYIIIVAVGGFLVFYVIQFVCRKQTFEFQYLNLEEAGCKKTKLAFTLNLPLLKAW